MPRAFLIKKAGSPRMHARSPCDGEMVSGKCCGHSSSETTAVDATNLKMTSPVLSDYHMAQSVFDYRHHIAAVRECLPMMLSTQSFSPPPTMMGQVPARQDEARDNSSPEPEVTSLPLSPVHNANPHSISAILSAPFKKRVTSPTQWLPYPAVYPYGHVAMMPRTEPVRVISSQAPPSPTGSLTSSGSCSPASISPMISPESPMSYWQRHSETIPTAQPMDVADNDAVAVASPERVSSFAWDLLKPSEGVVTSRRNEPPRFNCEGCGKSYATFSGLSKHKRFHCTSEVKREFRCKFCEKTYSSLGALKMHIRTHTLPCKCPLCGKAFSRPWLLQGHIRTHTGEKPFNCQHCARAFADRSNLRAHLQTHSDIKKYSCKTCTKTFSRMSLLVKHEEGSCQRSKQ